MEANENQIRHVVLQRMGRCTVCHRVFEDEDLQVMARNANVWMLMVRCGDCQARLFVAALVGDGDPRAASLALRQLVNETEIELEIPEDAINLDPEPVEPLSEVDVADMRDFLATFDGDFRRLFSADE